jgi:hypothetical protein
MEPSLLEAATAVLRAADEVSQQLFVLLWYQIGAPAYLVITGTAWPSPGVTLEWSYLLVGAMVVAGPLVFRRGR